MGVAMPSWNIHIAQTERLLERTGALAKSVRDRNAFLFGCVVPDIFVGYMVPGIADPIPYRITHFAKPEPIPKPREHEFWDTYVAPLLKSSPTGALAAATSIIEERERLNRVHYPQRYRDAEPVVCPGVLGCVFAGRKRKHTLQEARAPIARKRPRGNAGYAWQRQRQCGNNTR